jgi:hypothetical protein
MAFNKKAQCRTTYEDYLKYQSRQLLAKMTPEAKQNLLERIQAQIALLGKDPVNQELYQNIVNKLKECKEVKK